MRSIRCLPRIAAAAVVAAAVACEGDDITNITYVTPASALSEVQRALAERVAQTQLSNGAWDFSHLWYEPIDYASVGLQNVTGPAVLQGTWSIGGAEINTYRTFIIVVALAFTALTWLILYRTPIGTQVRAIIRNRQMAAACGIDGRAGRLLVVEAALLSVWEPDSGALLGRASGTWVDACLTPDGETVMAADMAGNLHHIEVASGLRDGVEVPADGPVIAVATDGTVVLASFARLPGLRERPL